MEIDKKLKVKTYKYFNFLQKNNNNIPIKQIVKTVKSKIKKIVSNSVISDRPVGFCLSGGIDSTGLVSVAKKLLNKKIKCFTIYTDDKKYDEFDMVNKTVKNLNLSHKWIKIIKISH